jgi:hypothetical protein
MAMLLSPTWLTATLVAVILASHCTLVARAQVLGDVIPPAQFISQNVRLQLTLGCSGKLRAGLTPWRHGRTTTSA